MAADGLSVVFDDKSRKGTKNTKKSVSGSKRNSNERSCSSLDSLSQEDSSMKFDDASIGSPSPTHSRGNVSSNAHSIGKSTGAISTGNTTSFSPHKMSRKRSNSGLNKQQFGAKPLANMKFNPFKTATNENPETKTAIIKRRTDSDDSDYDSEEAGDDVIEDLTATKDILAKKKLAAAQ